MVTLRDYQQKSIEAVRAAYKNGKRAPVLVLPTGAGKTVCFSYIAHSAGLKGNRVLILVHRQELIYQTSEKLTMFGVDHGIISPEFKQDNKPVQIAMVQTLVRRLDKTEKPDLIICDESHHIISGSYKKVIQWAECKILGVTATPCRLDGRGLGEVFDDICISVTTSDLIEGGFLSPYRFISIPTEKESMKNLKVKMGDYTSESMKQVFDGVVPAIVKSWKKYAENQPTIVFCPSVEISKIVAGLFVEAGYKFRAIYGDMDRLERKQIISDLASGEICGITSCDVISEGTDIPVATCAIMLRKTASTSLYIQQVGRVMRPVEGKIAIIIDMVQNYSDHGLPTAERSWTLDGKVRREPTKEKLCIECGCVNKSTAKKCIECGAHLDYKQCPNLECGAIILSEFKECPECGHDFSRKKIIKESENVQLKEIEQFNPQMKKKIQKPLMEFLESKGMKKGGAYYKVKLLETLSNNPYKATDEDWERAYRYHGSKEYGKERFVNYNKKLFKEFDQWQKLQKV